MCPSSAYRLNKEGKRAWHKVSFVLPAPAMLCAAGDAVAGNATCGRQDLAARNLEQTPCLVHRHTCNSSKPLAPKGSHVLLTLMGLSILMSLACLSLPHIAHGCLHPLLMQCRLLLFLLVHVLQAPGSPQGPDSPFVSEKKDSISTASHSPS